MEGDQLDSSNYRLISLTSSHSRVFERVLKTLILSEMSDKINYGQHRFRKNVQRKPICLFVTIL